jgi:hypothetical protein
VIRIFVMLLLSCSAALAEDISCQKKPTHNFVIECKSKKEADVSLLALNGGECASVAFHKHVGAEKAFEIPGTKECFYVRSVTLSIDGKSKTIGPL